MFNVIYCNKVIDLDGKEILEKFSDFDFGSNEESIISIDNKLIDSNLKFDKWIEEKLNISQISLTD